MPLGPVSSLAALLVLAVAAEWVADQVGIPSILPLLAAGFLAGPATGLLQPDALLGQTLFPVVSVAVAIILFEGGMNLRLDDLGPVWRPVVLLTTVGVVTTWLSTGFLAWSVLGLDPEVALLLGAILVVTGPTVIVPLFREMDVGGDVRTVAMWEGIVNDPLGAVLAISVYELAISGRAKPALVDAASTLLATLATGALFAAAGSALLIVVLYRGWVSEFLETPVTLGTVAGVFAAAEAVSPEAGLIATTAMGIVVANQGFVDVRRIAKFKETLGLILISVLFVLLAARFELAGFRQISGESVVFVALLVFVVRPAAVLLAGIPGDLNCRKLLALMVVAPRGVVSAALASLFSIKMLQTGHPEARQLDGAVFFVIACTVLLYGSLADPIVSALGIEEVEDS